MGGPVLDVATTTVSAVSDRAGGELPVGDADGKLLIGVDVEDVEKEEEIEKGVVDRRTKTETETETEAGTKAMTESFRQKAAVILLIDQRFSERMRSEIRAKVAQQVRKSRGKTREDKKQTASGGDLSEMVDADGDDDEEVVFRCFPSAEQEDGLEAGAGAGAEDKDEKSNSDLDAKAGPCTTTADWRDMDAISKLTKGLDQQCALQVLWFASSVGIKAPLAKEELQAYALLKDVRAKFPNSSRHLFTSAADKGEGAIAAIKHWMHILEMTYTHLDVFDFGQNTHKNKNKLFSLLSLQSLLVGRMQFSSHSLNACLSRLMKGDLCQAAWPELFQSGWPKKVKTNSRTGASLAAGKKRKRMATKKQEDKRLHILSVFNEDGTMKTNTHTKIKSATNSAAQARATHIRSIGSKNPIMSSAVQHAKPSAAHHHLHHYHHHHQQHQQQQHHLLYLSPRSKLSKEWRCWQRRVSSFSADQARHILQGEPSIDYWSPTTANTSNGNSIAIARKPTRSSKAKVTGEKSDRKVTTKRRLLLAP